MVESVFVAVMCATLRSLRYGVSWQCKDSKTVAICLLRHFTSSLRSLGTTSSNHSGKECDLWDRVMVMSSDAFFDRSRHSKAIFCEEQLIVDQMDE